MSRKVPSIRGSVLVFLTLTLSGVSTGAVQKLLTTQISRVATTPVFTIGTVHGGTTDTINTVLVTACNSAAGDFDTCFISDTNASLSSAGSLTIVPGNTISISIPAIASPLNFWQSFFPYNTPHTAIRITNSQGQDCDSQVVAYNCPTSSSCSVLSFSPVTCNFT